MLCRDVYKRQAIYVVPDNYLVKQVIDEAKKLGISVTEDKNDYNYSNSKAILVTSIQTIVNGYSYFGMREGGNYPIGSIIIDDVQMCIRDRPRKISIQRAVTVKSFRKAFGSFGKIGT